ncbi:MAG: hypothetical protein M3Q65_09265 [Chloroflexota bacterium]|nr:hypothetical protein [Chloroflexota bacterium]
MDRRGTWYNVKQHRPACRETGTPERQERHARGVADGPLRGCFAPTEHKAGSTAAGGATTARRQGDGYVLGGTGDRDRQEVRADLSCVHD